MLVITDSNDSMVLMDSLNNSKAFLMTNHEKEKETFTYLNILMDDKFEMEVQKQEKRSLGEQSIFVVVNNNDPVTNQEKQKEVSTEGLEMLKVVKRENGFNEQEQRFVEEEHPMFVATNSKALLMANQEKQKEIGSTKTLEMQKDVRFEGEVTKQEARYVQDIGSNSWKSKITM
jgi:hypothetical protein